VITEVEQAELIVLLRKHDLWLFSDEVYRLLGNPEFGWSDSAANIYEKAISLGVMSKAYGMPGLRVGWVACQDSDLLARARKIKHYTSICNSAPAEIISLIALDNVEKILKRNNQIVVDNISLLDNFFEKYNHLFSWVRPQGGCVGFVKYHGKQLMDEFCEELVKEKGVLLMPASVYSYESKHFRIGFGRKNMPEALAKLEEFIAE